MLQIAKQIKKYRKLRKMSLSTLAKNSRVQIATLSRIENGKMTGTIQCHLQISEALGISLPDLYMGSPESAISPIMQGEKLEIIASSNDKISTEILARQAASKKMLPTLIKMAPKSTTAPERGHVGSERFIFVLYGTLIIHINEQEIRLKEGSSLYFSASSEHTLKNPLNSPVKALSVMTPVIL